MLFSHHPVEWQPALEILPASRWPTAVSLPQFRELTDAGKWPYDLAPWIRSDVLEYLCNGQVDYRVRGIHVRLEVRWDWQAEQGDDTHQALYRGTRCRLAVWQGPAERFRPELYLVPDEDIGAALQRRIVALQPSYPGIAVEAQGSEWRIAIPDTLQIGHEATFAAFTRRFLAYIGDPASLPERESPNLV